MRLKLFLLVITLLTPSALATSYVMMRDDVLTDQARLVLVGSVERVEPVVANPPYTRYHIRLERLLKGQLQGETVAVDVLAASMLTGAAIEIGSSTSDSERFHQPRDFEEFADWLQDYSTGSRRQMDYFVKASEIQIPAISAFRLAAQPGRHDKFDKGERVEWVAFQGGQAEPVPT